MRLLISALAMLCTMSQANCATRLETKPALKPATSLPPQKKLTELKQTQQQAKKVQAKQNPAKQAQAKPMPAKPAVIKKPFNKVQNQNQDIFSSSSSSSSLSEHDDRAYIGAYTNNLEVAQQFDPYDLDSVLVNIDDTELYTQAMIFDTNEPGSPVNITHPTVGPDYTRFRIDKNGTYLITWTFTIGCLYDSEGEGEGCSNGTFVQLFDVAHQQPLFPNPMQFVDTEVFYPYNVDSETVSGQQLISLEAGAELQLRLIHAAFDEGDLWVANPSLTITRISN
ncbi:MAG: hypothetical protein LLF94_01415 [Chlamydiales bacterium]|nr:hypothetical protein [Chlamydiales bacterium]